MKKDTVSNPILSSKSAERMGASGWDNSANEEGWLI
jgi:hypothetical protein